MSRFRLFLLIICSALPLTLPAPAAAIPAITCHCFTERIYNAARPAAADPYFLATTQNSFMAAALGADKTAIVMKKQQGESADGLWVAYWIASRCGIDADTLLKRRKSKPSWAPVAREPLAAGRLPAGRAASLVSSGSPDSRIAEAVVNELLVRHRMLSEADIAALRAGGAGNQELILTGLLAVKTRQQPQQMYREIREKRTSWGALLLQANIDGMKIPAELSAITKKPSASTLP